MSASAASKSSSTAKAKVGRFVTLIEQMKAAQPGLIVFEATGGYESRAVKALSEAGFAVAVVNPTRVRRFAEGLGILTKTDKIDAQVIAHFANVV